MGYVVGVGVGSQSVKALLAGEDGSAIASAGALCAMSHPASGWAEQDASSWERALAQVVHEVRAKAGVRRGDVTAIGLACQVDGLVALDRNRRPLRPAIVGLDRRATAQSASLRDAVGETELVARTGLNPDASHTAPKAMWLRDEEPEQYRAARWLASVGGHLNGWLTGEVVHDHANASSSLLYDLRRRGWSDALVAGAGLDGDRLPEIRSACDVIGPLRPAAADALGLEPGCQVVVGTGDDHAAALGAGALTPGVVVDVTGTAEPVAVPSVDVVLDDARVVETHAHAVDDLLLVESPGFVSGGATRWWAEAQGVDQGEIFARAALAPAGSDGVRFLPALSGATAPRRNDRMRGAFAGLSLSHGAPHLARAVLEGCAFALRDVLDRFDALGLAGEEIRVVGGGARSALWLQIKADVTGRPMRPVESDCATTAGAAMLAAVATGAFDDLAHAAERMVRVADEPVAPDATTADAYAEAYGEYRRLFGSIEGMIS